MFCTLFSHNEHEHSFFLFLFFSLSSDQHLSFIVLHIIVGVALQLFLIYCNIAMTDTVFFSDMYRPILNQISYQVFMNFYQSFIINVTFVNMHVCEKEK